MDGGALRFGRGGRLGLSCAVPSPTSSAETLKSCLVGGGGGGARFVPGVGAVKFFCLFRAAIRSASELNFGSSTSAMVPDYPVVCPSS